MTRIKVFVYGTLKKGYSNNVILGDVEPIYKAYTTSMLMINQDGFPYAVDSNENDFIIGELYEIDEETLERCDMLEGYPDFYDRKQVSIYKLENILKGTPLHMPDDTAWVYYLSTDNWRRKEQIASMQNRMGTTHDWGPSYRNQMKEGVASSVL